jgi:hypothetical protein
VIIVHVLARVLVGVRARAGRVQARKGSERRARLRRQKRHTFSGARRSARLVHFKNRAKESQKLRLTHDPHPSSGPSLMDSTLALAVNET